MEQHAARQRSSIVFAWIGMILAEIMFTAFEVVSLVRMRRGR